MIGHTFRGLRFPMRLVGQICRVETASLFIAIVCMLILVEACLGSANATQASEVVVRAEGVSVVVRPSDGTYEIQTGVGGHTIIHARVASEIDHKWHKSTDYPKHEISQSTFEDALGHGKKITVTSSGLSNLPDLAYTLQIYDGRAFGVIETEVQNHTGKPLTIQSIRSVEAVGNKIIDLGGAEKSDRVLSDSFSEDWPPLQIYDLGKALKGMHRAVGSQLVYNREGTESLFVGALTSNRFLTIIHLQTQSSSPEGPSIGSYTVDSTGTTEIQATDAESVLREGPAENLIELKRSPFCRRISSCRTCDVCGWKRLSFATRSLRRRHSRAASQSHQPRQYAWMVELDRLLRKDHRRRYAHERSVAGREFEGSGLRLFSF